MQILKSDFLSKIYRSNIFFTVLFFSIALLFSLRHEPWRDEVDVWLAVRDLRFPDEIFLYCRRAGHPGLWYYIIYPLVKLNFSYFSIQILHITISSLSVFIILKFSNLKRFIKLLFVFGYFMIFEYTIIVRNYSVGILLLFMVASLWEKRKEHPVLFGIIIFLLCNTSIYFALISSSIVLVEIYELFKSKNRNIFQYSGIFIAISGGLLSIIQVIPASDGQFQTEIFQKIKPENIVLALNAAFLPTENFYGLGIILSLYIFYKSYKIIMPSGKIKFIYLYTLIVLFLFFAIFYMGGKRHLGILPVFLMFSFWLHSIEAQDFIFKENSNINLDKSLKYFNIIFIASLVYSVNSGISSLYGDWRNQFSGSLEMAKKIRDSNYDNGNYIIAAHSPDKGKVILPFIKIKEIYMPSQARFGSNTKWDAAYIKGELMTQEEVLEKFEKDIPDRSNYLLLLSDKISPKFEKKYILLFQNTPNTITFIKDETFYLYKPVNP